MTKISMSDEEMVKLIGAYERTIDRLKKAQLEHKEEMHKDRIKEYTEEVHLLRDKLIR